MPQTGDNDDKLQKKRQCQNVDMSTSGHEPERILKTRRAGGYAPNVLTAGACRCLDRPCNLATGGYRGSGETIAANLSSNTRRWLR